MTELLSTWQRDECITFVCEVCLLFVGLLSGSFYQVPHPLQRAGSPGPGTGPQAPPYGPQFITVDTTLP